MKSFFFKKYIDHGNLNLQHLGFQQTNRIYCNDGLTAKNSKLFRQARYLQKQHIIEKCYTNDGLVYAVISKDDGPILINDSRILQEIKNKLNTNTTLNIASHEDNSIPAKTDSINMAQNNVTKVTDIIVGQDQQLMLNTSTTTTSAQTTNNNKSSSTTKSVTNSSNNKEHTTMIVTRAAVRRGI